MLYYDEDNEQTAPMLALLIDQCDHLEELMDLMRRQLEAMRTADPDAVTGMRSEQNEINRKLEISRRQIDRKML